jgi:RNA polymerase sigma-70 factor (ECF subfamily)
VFRKFFAPAKQGREETERTRRSPILELVPQLAIEPMTTSAEPDPALDELRPDGWVDAHGDHLFRFAMHRVGSAAIAEELVQETLLSALQHVDSFDGRSRLRTWLVSILRHKIADHFRRAGRERESASLDALGGEELFTTGGKWTAAPRRFRWPGSGEERADLLRALTSCLEKLPGHTAEMFILHEQRRVPPEQLAASVGISTGSLAARMYRARLQLRSCLETSWFAGEAS